MSRRRPLVAVLFAAILVLPSCFTTALWSDDDDQGLAADSIAARLALTPLALCLDLVTLCAQAAICGDDDDDHDRQRRRDCRGDRHR